MEWAVIALGVLFIVALGGAVWLLIERGKLSTARATAVEQRDQSVESLRVREEELRLLRAQHERINAEAANLRGRMEEAEKRDEDLRQRLAEAHGEYQKAFDALAGRALKGASDQFLTLAKQHFETEQTRSKAALEAQVKPITETLGQTKQKLEQIERERLDAYSSLRTQIQALSESEGLLRKETAGLVQALRRPQVRGRYGEVQLRRVVELAGMREYCDFDTQESARDEAGALKRPDMVVRLPNGRCIAVDAKTNIEAYLDAIEARTPEEADGHLSRFAEHVAGQATALAKKEYWAEFDGAIDFVVMFVPGDQFIDAALRCRPDLIDMAATNRVILASPSTLIGLLRAVYVGWRERSLSERAEELFDLGCQLHERAEKVLRDAERVGKAIDAAGQAYNAFVGSVDARLMPTLRKFEEAGAKSERELPEPAPVEVNIRPIKSLAAPSAADD